MINCVAIVSGGIDSVVMLHHLVKNCSYSPLVLIFDYEQESSKEIQFAQEHAVNLGLRWELMNLSFPPPEILPGKERATYIPARNLVFLSIAVATAEGWGVKPVFIGLHEGIDTPDPVYMIWDSTSTFVNNFNNVLTLNERHDVKVYAPLLTYTKGQIIQLGHSLKVDFTKTWSCLENRDKACGKCPMCITRLKKFKMVGIKDPLEYEV